jgi:hypothetical protein
LERCILSNSRKFAQAVTKFGKNAVKFMKAVDRGLDNLASDIGEDLRRPDLFLMRNAVGVFELTVNLISAISKEEFLSEELLRATMSGNTQVYDQAAEEYVRESQERLNKIEARLQTIKEMPWDSKVEAFVHHGGRLLFDILTLKILRTGFKIGKVKYQQLSTELKTLRRASKETLKTAGTLNAIDPISEGFKNVTIGGKNYVEGPLRTGTVWDNIKVTDTMYSNTKIPRSFEISVGNQKFWVHPNATKHMWEYLRKAISTTHSMPINSQTLLSSFKAAFEDALAQGIQFDQIFTSGCWEFKIGQAKKQGLLPSIFHAQFVPKGI